MNTKQLCDGALAPPQEDRADLALELLRSLDGEPDAGAENAWVLEIQKRVDELASGSLQAIGRRYLSGLGTPILKGWSPSINGVGRHYNGIPGVGSTKLLAAPREGGPESRERGPNRGATAEVGLASYRDDTVFLEAPERRRRELASREARRSEEEMDGHRERYMAGWRLHVDECRPASRATRRIVNDDFAAPVLMDGDAP